MKKFKFSMQGVLHVYDTKKRVCEMEYAKAKLALDKDLEKLAAIDAQIQQALNPEKVFQYPTGAYFLQREKYLRFLKDKRKDQVVKVQFAKAAVRDRLRQLQAAMVELKKMEKTRDREFERWKVDFLREEQRDNDEIASAQSFYRDRDMVIAS